MPDMAGMTADIDGTAPVTTGRRIRLTTLIRGGSDGGPAPATILAIELRDRVRMRRLI